MFNKKVGGEGGNLYFIFLLPARAKSNWISLFKVASLKLQPFKRGFMSLAH